MGKATAYVTRAPFRIGTAGWTWHTWMSEHGNKHAAINEKAAELGAHSWDFGQADHDEFSRSRHAGTALYLARKAVAKDGGK